MRPSNGSVDLCGREDDGLQLICFSLGSRRVQEEFVNNPLSPSQEALRGRKVVDMSIEQLREWIDACNRMEAWKYTPAKARRGWKVSRAKAEAEFERRKRPA